MSERDRERERERERGREREREREREIKSWNYEDKFSEKEMKQQYQNDHGKCSVEHKNKTIKAKY